MRNIIMLLSLLAALWAAPVAAAEARYRVLVPLTPARSISSSSVEARTLLRAPVPLHGIATWGRSAWAVGDQRFITATRDGGATWQTQLEPQLGATWFYGAAAASDQVAWVVGANGPASAIFGTRDGGTTWVRQDTGAAGGLRAVSSPSPGIAWAVGDAGTILATTNGTSWARQSSGTTEDLVSVVALSSTTAMAVGWAGLILGTTDGGAHWTVRLNTGPNSDPRAGVRLYGVAFANATFGWVVGLESSFERDDHDAEVETVQAVVYATRDGGATWARQTLPSGVKDLIAVAAVSASEVWAGGSGSGLVMTRDGGVTWLQAPSEGYHSYEGIAIGDGGLWGVGDYSVRSIDTRSLPAVRR